MYSSDSPDCSNDEDIDRWLLEQLCFWQYAHWLHRQMKISYIIFHCYEPLIFTHQGGYWVDGMPEDFRMALHKTVDEIKKLTKKYLPNNEIMLEPVKQEECLFGSSFLSSSLRMH